MIAMDIYKTDQNEIAQNRLSILELQPRTDVNIKKADQILENKINERKDVHYVPFKDRLDRTPVNSEKGEWTAGRGCSKFNPSEFTVEGREAIKKLSEFGLVGIDYREAEPDFSKCSIATVEIDSMSSERYGSGNNFHQADTKLAEKFNQEQKDGRADWTSHEVRDLRRENRWIWHETCDMRTMNLVPEEIHSFFTHSGGCAECRARDNKSVEKGSVFDE